MKRNIHELPELIRMCGEKGVELFSISNVLAYTPELREEVIYERTLIDGAYQSINRATATNFQYPNDSIHADIETKELMVEFYKNIQSGKISRCQALRQAALRQMQIAKERYGSTNPLLLGCFYISG